MNWIATENEESFWKKTFLRTSWRWNLFWKLRDGPEYEARKWDHSENVEWKEIQVSPSLNWTFVIKRALTREVREKNVIGWRPRVDVTLTSMAWRAIKTAKNLTVKKRRCWEKYNRKNVLVTLGAFPGFFFFFSLKNRGLVRRVGLQRLPVLKRILFQKQEKDTEKISKLVKFGFTWILTEAPLRRK